MSAGAQLVALGAGSILPRAGYGCAGYAVLDGSGGPATLLDCGPGTLRALGACGIPLDRIERVIVSHFHLDHVLDLFALAFARRNPAFEAPPLELVGPVGLAALLERAAAAFGKWAAFADTRVIEVEPALAPRALERGRLRLACVATEHTPESLAWRVELEGGARLAYTGDSGERPQVAALASEVDLFLAECSFPEEQAVANHLTPSGAARLAAEARCSRLILTHFYPSMDPALAADRAAAHFSGPIETARDGSRHPLTCNRTRNGTR